MNKRIITILVAVATVLVSAGTTLAYLAASSRPVINYFTIGDITLSLSETTGNIYQMIPGTKISKDPRLTVGAGSDACWLFCKIDQSDTFDRYMTYAIADGWTALPSMVGVYYRQVEKATADLSFPLLAEDSVTVKDTATEGDLAAVTAPPTLTFYGYAIQSDSVDTAERAWLLLREEE